MTEIVIPVTVALAGEYRMVLNAGSPQERDTGWFSNMILDNGLNMLGSSAAAVLVHCSVGTGTAAPAAGQTALTAYLANKNGGGTATAANLGVGGGYVGQWTNSWVFPQGAVVGNIAEVGVGPTASGTNLFSRARIVDGSGTPTTLTVVALDQLTVYYRITATPVLTDATGSFLISGVSYNYVHRLAMAANFMAVPGAYTGIDRLGTVSFANTYAYNAASVLGAIASTPTGTQMAASSASIAAYGTGNFYNDATIVWNPASGNGVGGIGTIMVYWAATTAHMRSQMSFSPAIPKDNTKTLSLVFRFSWSR